jgi:hypothetical protein
MSSSFPSMLFDVKHFLNLWTVDSDELPFHAVFTPQAMPQTVSLFSQLELVGNFQTATIHHKCGVSDP